MMRIKKSAGLDKFGYGAEGAAVDGARTKLTKSLEVRPGAVTLVRSKIVIRIDLVKINHFLIS